MLAPPSEVVFTQLDPPAVMFSPLRVQRRLRCSLGARDARRLFHVPQLKLSSYPFLLLSSPMRCLGLKFGRQKFIPGISLQCWEDNEACIAIATKGFSAKLRYFSKTHWINVASVCETVNGHQDIKLSYINISEQRSDPLTKTLSVQKWFHALDLLSISTLRLPDFPVSE